MAAKLLDRRASVNHDHDVAYNPYLLATVAREEAKNLANMHNVKAAHKIRDNAIMTIVKWRLAPIRTAAAAAKSEAAKAAASESVRQARATPPRPLSMGRRLIKATGKLAQRITREGDTTKLTQHIEGLAHRIVSTLASTTAPSDAAAWDQDDDEDDEYDLYGVDVSDDENKDEDRDADDDDRDDGQGEFTVVCA